MKSKDWTVIAVVVVIAGMVSFVASNFLLGGQKAPRLKVEVVQAISSDFPLPNDKYFNANSINPTKEITIGDNNNQSPFNGR